MFSRLSTLQPQSQARAEGSPATSDRHDFRRCRSVKPEGEQWEYWQACFEQARLFRYFNASGSQAGCGFVKALYCISFLCQSPFPVAVPCQAMTLCFLQVAWRRACHEPRGPSTSHWTPRVPSLRLLSSRSQALPLLELIFFFLTPLLTSI